MPAHAIAHTPVLLDAVLDRLRPQRGGIFVDCTFGRGGHARALLGCVGPSGRVIAADRDPEAVAAGRILAARDRRLSITHACFSDLDRIVETEGVRGKVNGVLLDLGVSSPQLSDPRRGFSFQDDGPLDMRMDPGAGTAVREWLARASLDEITEVLRRYGEEPRARRIARAIVRHRGERPIETTADLAGLVAAATPASAVRRAGAYHRARHPATRTFQALRIMVNDELGELERALAVAPGVLAVHGRLAVISFHSLEDRCVKRFMRREARGSAPRGLPLRATDMHPRLIPVGKAVHAGSAEIACNPRARSAVLRAAERPA